jgi:hypothetical protein
MAGSASTKYAEVELWWLHRLTVCQEVDLRAQNLMLAGIMQVFAPNNQMRSNAQVSWRASGVDSTVV